MDPLGELLGESPGVVAVRERVARLLSRQLVLRRLPPVLVLGETGTGKGLLARALHRAGPRAAGPFVEVNCAAIPEVLLEAEMFGVESGAFTGARQAARGLFRAADGGTLFLDEVGLLPEGPQAKLLKVLEERVVRPLGSTQSEPVDVWVMAATSEDLGASARAGRFRPDLYHRLAIVTLALPPLRDRGRDVLLLGGQFLARASADYGLEPRALAPDARAALLAYPWPGNVRELSNVMERTALLAPGPVVTAAALGLPAATAPETSPGPAPLAETVRTVERTHILRVLEESRWNVSRAAVRLGISRNTLRYRIARHALRRGTVSPHRPAAAPPAPAGGPGAVGSPSAPAGLRWESREVAVLRVALGPSGAAPVPSSRALEALVERVRGFGGRVEEVSPAGLVAAFGLEGGGGAAPRAAQAALAIRRGAEADGLVTRMGLHAGPAMVARDAAGMLEIDETAKREAWRVVESLVAAAPPALVLVSEAARPRLEGGFELEATGQAYRLSRLREARRPG